MKNLLQKLFRSEVGAGLVELLTTGNAREEHLRGKKRLPDRRLRGVEFKCAFNLHPVLTPQ